MILIPAIDIKGGKVVRLFQGKFSKAKEYADSPLQAAKTWERLGARWLHVVDLDGAETGMMRNQESFSRIIEEAHIPIQIGGGIRNPEMVKRLMTMGASRVILGTKAIQDRFFLKEMLALYGQKICVSLDCSGGFVAERGWVSTTNIKADDFALELEAMGLQWMVYTDISRDGTLTGPDVESLQQMLNTVSKINIIASGGLASLEDVKTLKGLKSKEGGSLAAAISGKALYEGRLDFKKAMELLD